MNAVTTCTVAANGTPPLKGELRLKAGDPANSDYGNIGYVLMQGAQALAVGNDYALTISALPGPGGTPLRRAKLQVTAAGTAPDGKFTAALRLVQGDPLNAGLTAANLAITVISHQEFVVGAQHIVDIDPA